jgi:hypothetical protein
VDAMKVGFIEVSRLMVVGTSNHQGEEGPGGDAMTNDSEGRQDQAWPGAVRWELGDASVHGRETLWQCDALRAGQLYQRSVFATREEAEAFVVKMQEMEPDQMFSVAAIKASTVWN